MTSFKDKVLGLVGMGPGETGSEDDRLEPRRVVNTSDQLALKACLDDTVAWYYLDERAENLDSSEPGPFGMVESHGYNNIRLVLGYLSVACVGFSLWWSWMHSNNPRYSAPTGWGAAGFFFFSFLMQIIVSHLGPRRDTLFVFNKEKTQEAIAALPEGETSTLATALMAQNLSAVRSFMERYSYVYELALVAENGKELRIKKNVGQFFTEKGEFIDENFSKMVLGLAEQFAATGAADKKTD